MIPHNIVINTYYLDAFKCLLLIIGSLNDNLRKYLMTLQETNGIVQNNNNLNIKKSKI